MASDFKRQRSRRQRVARIRNGILLFLFLYIVGSIAALGWLGFRVFSLQKQIDILVEHEVKTGSVDQEENASAAGEQEVSAQEAESAAVAAEAEEESVETEAKLTQEAAMESEDVKKIYLTFDDGPSGKTEEILDILDDYGVKATFFVVGKEDDHSKKMYRKIVEKGHTLAMHSYSHRYNEIYSSKEAFEKDLEKIQNLLYDATGQDSVFYRFPGGSSNQVSNTSMKEFIRLLNDHGITYFDWNVSSGDATSQAYTTDELVENVMNDVVKYNTSVVLMHDSDTKPATVEALPQLIEALMSEDDMLLPITGDTPLVQHIKVEDVVKEQ